MLKAPSYLAKNKIFILLAILVLTFLVLGLLSPTSYGGADDFVHFRFAKYSFKYPYLLLDHWAKPVFTLLASPFAQLGYGGVKLFNILVGALTAYILWKTAKILGLAKRELLAVFLFFTPVYTTMLLSGMTEILFSFVLTLAVYQVLNKKIIWSAIVISFLPLVRTEGIVIWPLFVAAFCILRSWKALPFIITGSLIYSIIGGLYFKDFLWLVHKMPYTHTNDVYGQGDFFHFAHSNKLIFGPPLTFLFFAGIVSLVLRLINRKKENSLSIYLETLIILGPLTSYYLAHSYFWWKGMSSMGLLRVMAAVAPLFVLISLRGLNLLTNSISIKEFRLVLKGFFILYVIIIPFQVYEIPLKLTSNAELVRSAAKWYGNSIYKNRKYYVWDSYFYFALGTDPYDPNKMADGIPNREHSEVGVKPGEIVIWDAHFSAVDGRFPLSGIIDNPYFKLVKIFRPVVPFKAAGGDYQLCFFERLKSKSSYNNRKILDSLIQQNLKIKESQILNQNFGPKGLKISKEQEFYLFKEINTSNVDCLLKIKLTSGGEPIFLVISTGNRNKINFYKSWEINKNNNIETNIETTEIIPKSENKRESLKIYLWNPKKGEAYIRKIGISLTM